MMAENNPKLLELLHSIAKEQNLQNYKLTVKPVSSNGANYTSHLYTAVLTSPTSPDLHLFIKVAAVGEKFRDDTGMNIYANETFIYTDLRKTFRQLEDKYNIRDTDRLSIAKYYGANTVTLQEMLVLENLVSRGLECQDRMKSVNWEYAAAAILELAKLHALSMAYKRDYPEHFESTRKQLSIEVSSQSESLNVFWETSRNAALREVRPENRQRLEEFLKAIDMITFWELYKPYKTEVLMHGDYRMSNLMHGRRDDGTLEVVPVDYQTIRGGSPVVDLYYFIFTGTDAQFRAKYYQRLLDHYYEQLAAAMIRLHLDPREKYSREDFDAELKEKLPFGLSVAVFALPIVTVEAENAPKVDQNLELTDFSIQKTGATFPERLNGVVDDFVRWGVL